jgi:hypothetical protein
MQIRIALLATLLVGASSCATEAEQKQAGAAAPAAPVSTTAATPQAAPQSREYRPITGSRLRSLDDDTGAAYVGEQNRQDYMDDMNKRVSPTRGN